jgi:hypothetical protein
MLLDSSEMLRLAFLPSPPFPLSPTYPPGEMIIRYCSGLKNDCLSTVVFAVHENESLAHLVFRCSN